MRRKHVVSIALLSVLMLVGLTAPVAAGAVRVGVAYDSPLGDLSFNDITHAGVVAAEADLPIVVKEMDPFNVRGEFVGFEGVIETLAERADLVVSVGVLYGDAVGAVAEERPDLDFVTLDNLVDLPNVASVIFAAHEGAFLVGAAAALTSETDTVGFIGGVDIFPVQNFEAGYLAGVEHVNPGVEVLSEYISLAPDFSGFGDPERAYEIATDMYEAGADVVFHAAGGSGFGLFVAADEFSDANEHVWAIGVDSDQYLAVEPDLQEHILTSALKRLDVATYDMIEAKVTGTFTGGLKIFGLAVEGVGYATSGGFLDGIIDDLEAMKADIIDGTIIVPWLP